MISSPTRRNQQPCPNMKTRINRAAVVAIIAIQALWLSGLGECGQPNPSWVRTMLHTRVEPINAPQLEIWCTKEESGKLVGCSALANVQSGSYKPVRLIIEGEWRNGLFWPTIMSQVGDLAKGPWHTIRSRSSKRESARVVLRPGDRLTDLRVNLEPFREYVGKYQVGRIILTSGDAAVFELSDLKPPS